MKRILTAAAIVVLAGCAVPLTPGAEKVELITSAQKERCERIKLITFNQRLGPDKPGNAMRQALNQAAAFGANGFYVVSTATDWAEGASVVGEAFRCKR
jgi:hypothetical protein